MPNLIGLRSCFLNKSGGWSPLKEASLSNWWTGSDFASVTNQNTNVSAWRSQTASGDVLVQGNVANQPAHSNLLKCVDFQNASNKNVNDTSITTGAITSGDHCIFGVFESDKVNSHWFFNADNTANPGSAIRYWQPTDSFLVYCNDTASTGNIGPSASTYVANTKVLLGLIVSGTALSASFNGTITAGGTATPFTATRLIIGRSLLSLGKVYDVMLFSSASTTIYQKAEGFLAWNHGITLPVGHPYEFARP